MSQGYVIPVDPTELSNRFSYTPGEPDEEENSEYEEKEPSTEDIALFTGSDYETRIKPLLDRIPEREADLITLYFLRKKRQADIAVIFGVTQAAISYRLDRGIQRIKFLLSIPQVTEGDLRRDLPKVFPKPVDVDILVGMWETTCQSEVAKSLGRTQGQVRHRFFKAVKILEAAAAKDPEFEPYHKVFSAIAGKNFNILREVKLPQWSDRGGDECF
jgi:DNA-directed RNA polymerase specialized sigma24 family protein